MFSLICAWTNGWINNREASDLRHHHAHYDVTVMSTRHKWQIANLVVFSNATRSIVRWPWKPNCSKTSNMGRTSEGDNTVNHSDVVGESPCRCPPTTSSLSSVSGFGAHYIRGLIVGSFLWLLDDHRTHYDDVIMGAIESQITPLFRRRSKKTSKLRVTGLCAGNSPVTGEFPAQMASNAENASIWWRHHVTAVWEVSDAENRSYISA